MLILYLNEKSVNRNYKKVKAFRTCQIDFLKLKILILLGLVRFLRLRSSLRFILLINKS